MDLRRDSSRWDRNEMPADTVAEVFICSIIRIEVVGVDNNMKCDVSWPWLYPEPIICNENSPFVLIFRHGNLATM